MRSPRPDSWFRSSERDLGMARHLLGAGFYEGVAFHSQQAAEKILKGLLISRHCLWRRTHSCAELLAALARLGDTLPESLLGAAAEQALVTAETIAAFVKKRLAQGPTPGPGAVTRPTATTILFSSPTPSPTLSPPSDGSGPIEPGRPQDLSATPTSSASPRLN